MTLHPAFNLFLSPLKQLSLISPLRSPLMDGVAATRADMVEFGGVFDSWTAWLSTQLHAHASQHAHFISESTEEVTALRAKQQQLARTQQHNSKGSSRTQHRQSGACER